MNKCITKPHRNMWLDLQFVLFASSVSFHEYGVKNITHLASGLFLQSHELVEDLTDLKGPVLSSEGQTASAREGPTAISFPPTEIRCYYIVQIVFPLYRIETVYKYHTSSRRVTA